jgi:serine/threonine protein kinase
MANAGQLYQGQYLGRQFGNYRLVKLLGEGGFAEVYLGEQVYLGTQAAVKVLTARLTSDEIERFHAEAQTSMNLHHPHIVLE